MNSKITLAANWVSFNLWFSIDVPIDESWLEIEATVIIIIQLSILLSIEHCPLDYYCARTLCPYASSSDGISGSNFLSWTVAAVALLLCSWVAVVINCIFESAVYFISIMWRSMSKCEDQCRLKSQLQLTTRVEYQWISVPAKWPCSWISMNIDASKMALFIEKKTASQYASEYTITSMLVSCHGRSKST